MQSGNKVICINDSWPSWALKMYVALPKKGEAYTVRDVGIARVMPNAPRMENDKIVMDGGEPEVAITLVGLVNPPDPFHADKGELSFNSNRFRLVEKNKTEEHYHEYAEA
jgi:hypothetical protein